MARGDTDKSISIAGEAVAIAEPADFLFLQSFVLERLGEVLHVADLLEEADDVRLCEQRGFVVGARQARGRREKAPASGPKPL
jgi:hypothetical protein